MGNKIKNNKGNMTEQQQKPKEEQRKQEERKAGDNKIKKSKGEPEDRAVPWNMKREE